MRDVLELHPEVQQAIADKRGVVALESTLLAHGMPHDRRVDIARRMDETVRRHGAVPAVIAVMDGKVRVGLTTQETQLLCTHPTVHKCGERDLAFAVAHGGMHATTVSATMWAAAQAGIPVFSTGGIGGVHRHAEKTFDESQDLAALATHPVAVISAGAKAILDLPRTLERLETLGVPVVGYRCREFPAFYTPHSGLTLDAHVADMDLLVRVVHTRLHVLDQGGMLVCNPVPKEDALDPTLMDAALDAALAEAEDKHIHGKALTPYLLAAMERFTGGQSVNTNIALAMNNVVLGAELASRLAELERA